MQDSLKINEKSKNRFQNVLKRIKRLRVKQGQITNLSQIKKIQKILRDILKNKIKYIEKKTDLLKNALVNVEKRKGLFEKGLKKIAKIRRIKNYEDMKKEDILIISFLKSKESIAELFNDNRYDNEISDIRRIPSRLRDILLKKTERKLKISFTK